MNPDADDDRRPSCPVCMEVYARVAPAIPTTLPCGHSVCIACVAPLETCPTCRAPKPADFANTPSYGLLDAIEALLGAPAPVPMVVAPVPAPIVVAPVRRPSPPPPAPVVADNVRRPKSWMEQLAHQIAERDDIIRREPDIMIRVAWGTTLPPDGGRPYTIHRGTHFRQFERDTLKINPRSHTKLYHHRPGVGTTPVNMDRHLTFYDADFDEGDTLLIKIN